MRTLTASLAAAQKQASPLPFIDAVFSDYYGDVSRLRFSRHYSGSEGEYFSAVALAGDGSLSRARVDPTTKVLFTQRVASPGATSDFSQWTSHGAVSAGGAVALAASGSSVFLYYVDADTLTLKEKASTDSGASYGSAVTVATAAAAVTYLAAAVASGGDRVLFWTVGATVWRSRFSGSTWGTATAWTNAAASLTGIACLYRLDWNLAVCGTEPTSLDAKVWTTVYGDGAFQAADTWSALKEVTTANASSNVSFRAPAVQFLQHWRLFFVEKYTGALAYARLQWSTMNNSADFDQELWREPAPFDYTGNYGVAAAAAGGLVWLAAAAGVWSGASPSTPDLDVGADVLEAVVDLSEYDGRARLVLRNDDGRFNAPGTGAAAALRRGARLKLAAGYRTAAGGEASTGPAYWVESLEHLTGGSARLVVEARDAWWLLDRWRARRQFVWTAGSKSVSQISQFLCARAGLDYGAVSASAALTGVKPAFTVHAGESGRTAVRRLLAMVPDEAIMQGARCAGRFPQTGDGVDYAFGVDHAIVEGRYRDLGASLNRARVFGDAVFDEAFDFAEIDSLGERIAQIFDLNLTTTAAAGDRAGFALRDAAVRQRGDELLLAGINCGQELYDVVSVTDAQLGLVAAKRRVLGLTWRYATGRQARYDMTLLLGSP